jgi:hypothetical protein
MVGGGSCWQERPSWPCSVKLSPELLETCTYSVRIFSVMNVSTASAHPDFCEFAAFVRCWRCIGFYLMIRHLFTRFLDSQSLWSDVCSIGMRI